MFSVNVGTSALQCGTFVIGLRITQSKPKNHVCGERDIALTEQMRKVRPHHLTQACSGRPEKPTHTQAPFPRWA